MLKMTNQIEMTVHDTSCLHMLLSNLVSVECRQRSATDKAKTFELIKMPFGWG